MKKILIFSLVFCFTVFICLTISNQAESAPKKKLPAISISAIKQQIQKAKDIADSLDNIFRSLAVDYEIRQEVEGSNYSASLMAGREQAQKAESALSRVKYRKALDSITASLQNLAQARQAILGSAKWVATKDERIAEWQRLIAEVEARIPEALKKSIFSDGNVNLSDDILLTCAIPNVVPAKRYCQGQWEIRKNLADCPYLACVKGKKEILPCAGAMSYVNRNPKSGPTNQKCCPGLYLTKTKNNEFMCQRTEGGVECLKDTDCPQPLCTEISALCMLGKCARPTCMTIVMSGPRPASEASPAQGEPASACCLPDGSCSVATQQICDSMYGKMTDKKSCGLNKCKPFASTAPPVHSTYDKCVIEGVKDYKCSSKKTISWSCQCFNFSEQPVADYYYQCGLKPVESCPAPTRYAPLAVTGIHIRYQMSPAIQIFWDTNKPTISQMEYGETTAYGSVFQGINSTGSADTPDKLHFLDNEGLYVGLGENAKLRPDTIYHFRIVATDAKGNKLISDDYTFSTTKPYGSKHWIMCKEGEVRQKTCVNGELVDMCKCTADGVWSCLLGSIATSCPAPTPASAPADKSVPASVTPLPATVVTGECKIGDAKYYECPDKIQVHWCKCVVGEKWDCVSAPEKSCAAATAAPSNTATDLIKK